MRRMRDAQRPPEPPVPRTARIVVPNYPHHVVQRGHNRGDVFMTSGDRLAYLDTLREFRELLGLRLYAYCLMSNHVHLIVDPGADATTISSLMKRLAGRHTRRINRLEQRTGTAWDGRFKCSVIETGRYLLACHRYVDLNPVLARMVARPEDYPWSSYRVLTGCVPSAWLDESPTYRALGASATERQQRYAGFVGLGIPEAELRFIRTAARRNQLTGSEDFAREIAGRVGRTISSRARGRPVGAVHSSQGQTYGPHRGK